MDFLENHISAKLFTQLLCDTQSSWRGYKLYDARLYILAKYRGVKWKAHTVYYTPIQRAFSFQINKPRRVLRSIEPHFWPMFIFDYLHDKGISIYDPARKKNTWQTC